MDNILKGLNEPQKEAVLHTRGPLLVVAGAGAGKTKIITHRVANLIKTGVKPENILAVTFTNKAAGEMKSRISQLLKLNLPTGQAGFNSSTPTVGTFHSICARILRENARHIARPRDFSILNKEDSLKIIKKCFKELGVNPKQFNPAKVQNIISKQKSNLIKPDEFMSEDRENFFPKTISALWQEYEKQLHKQKALDFDDLIAKTVFLFQKKPEILGRYEKKWTHFLVDEYQDTNYAQYILTKLLARKNKNICVVGDEDQSIYKFRGADFGNILNFEKDWLNTKVVMLEQNYRSTQNILKTANAVISRNKLRKPKNLFSETEDGEGLTIFDGLNEKEEAEFVAQASENLIQKGLKPQEIAVLYRANFQSRAVEESLLNRGLPYQVIGTKFFERKEVKDIIAYLKAAVNPQDNLSLERIINEPPRGIGRASLINYISERDMAPDKKNKVENFFNLLAKTKKIIAEKTLHESIAWLIKESGYKNHLDDGAEEGITRMENLKELTALSVKYDSAEKFLEDIALLTDQDTMEENKKGIRLMTVHAAKGLEFSCVFITGLEEGLFPFSKPGQTPEDEEEERRLFYVALTRAKKQIFLSFSRSRSFFGGKQMNKPSRFLNDIPEELFKKDTEELPTTNYLEI
ncbi:MAG: ATP-dependent DNA helicase PcrA [Candidatus Tagabacteria bacterium CG09_land_8_20_14_0_10_41_14]|uniref:DNA 3'-5' helicase n=2 Tax=Candidatus Tagaibacteriota TaxID=1817918 RepID=A0A2H0WLP1_9BACT|nr:MAG: ATP-dependent DNA helicase PcrA [Candidatus Tagabacteria bacterium CG09_land_8_20_14_0_10_41_14]PJE72861.1 MAG: ATP-dependent DNA helicase PcrA [Candidatus Tagabacteria bacterium CG10_big_fil_rev_8_21_14_0_10_40_13]